jgi:hypothetical protein
LPDPDTKRPLPARALGGPPIKVEAGHDARVALFEWMRSPDNPYFARSFVNRVWGHYFGVGIVDPVDNFSVANPPSNEKLLDALARDFVAHGYDIRHVERAILLSRVYQLSPLTNETNRLDRRNYSHSYIRPLMAEVVVDVINAALGVTENFGKDAPPGARAIEVGASRLQEGNAAYAFGIFGRSPRAAACDCERAPEPGLGQRLYMMVDPLLWEKLRATTRPGSRFDQMLRRGLKPNDMLDELFLMTLSRFPNEGERRAFAQHRSSRLGAEGTLNDALWALLNTREFILNH